MKPLLFLLGPAGKKSPEYRAEEQEIFRCLSQRVARGEKCLAVTGTSWNSDTEVRVLRYCKEQGIPSISILDYWGNYKSRFRLGEQYFFPDYYFVMDRIAAEEAMEDGCPRNAIRIVGQPGLDVYVKKRLEPSGNRKLLFLSQPLSAIYEKEVLGYTEFDAMEDLVKAAASLGYRVGVKFHPKESAEMRERYASLEVDGDFLEVVSNYEAVVGMSTMGLLQCALMGIPVISYQPNLRGEDFCITNKLKITEGAFSYQQLCAQVERLKQRKSVRPDEDSLIWLDGKSTERCVEAIYSIGRI